MQDYRLKLENGPDLIFEGELLGESSTARYTYHSDLKAGHDGGSDTCHDYRVLVPNQRWTDLALYRTAGGNYICHQVSNTNKPGENPWYKGKAVDNLAGVFGFFGCGWLSKELYEDAGLDFSVFIE